jgi:dolichol-phosphate mannosyltransferase
MKLSVVIPAYNEAKSITETVEAFSSELTKEKIPHEILVVNDNSKDNTIEVLTALEKKNKNVRHVNNTPPNGLGFAVRCGLNNYEGDCVALVMADMSDRPVDLVKYYRTMVEGGYDCVFGSRFIKGGKVTDYPGNKIFLNRFTNSLIRLLFWYRYNDTTNAFKLYSREAMEGIKPLISQHFNLTVEMPLKAIIRGYTYTVVPNHWTNRKEGVSNLKIKEMGSRYFFIIFYCLVEKWFSRGDYKKKAD